MRSAYFIDEVCRCFFCYHTACIYRRSSYVMHNYHGFSGLFSVLSRVTQRVERVNIQRIQYSTMKRMRAVDFELGRL